MLLVLSNLLLLLLLLLLPGIFPGSAGVKQAAAEGGRHQQLQHHSAGVHSATSQPMCC
jgi:hypothetical protein